MYVSFAEHGYHTVRRSDQFCGGLWTDLIIEQVMMRSIKSWWSDTKAIEPQSLPPTERAAYCHSLRVHFQVMQWKELSLTCLEPTEWGWKLDHLMPITTDQDAAPPSLLNFVRCKCSMSS